MVIMENDRQVQVTEAGPPPTGSPSQTGQVTSSGATATTTTGAVQRHIITRSQDTRAPAVTALTKGMAAPELEGDFSRIPLVEVNANRALAELRDAHHTHVQQSGLDINLDPEKSYLIPYNARLEKVLSKVKTRLVAHCT